MNLCCSMTFRNSGIGSVGSMIGATGGADTSTTRLPEAGEERRTGTGRSPDAFGKEDGGGVSPLLPDFEIRRKTAKTTEAKPASTVPAFLEKGNFIREIGMPGFRPASHDFEA
jgi:hypothetical protein